MSKTVFPLSVSVIQHLYDVWNLKTIYLSKNAPWKISWLLIKLLSLFNTIAILPFYISGLVSFCLTEIWLILHDWDLTLFTWQRFDPFCLTQIWQILPDRDSSFLVWQSVILFCQTELDSFFTDKRFNPFYLMEI